MEVKNTIRLYNTMTREIEDFFPLVSNQVSFYACGPTVYDNSHIGHIRRYFFDDVLIRLLRYLAYDVKHVMNVTDVGHLVSDADSGEDKLEKGAKREGKTAWDIAKIYEQQFWKTIDGMHIVRPNIICRATEHIQDQIALITKLEAKGYTYKIADGIYFDSTKFADYGKLSKLNPEGQQPGIRVEMVTGKKHPTDFALWKFSYPDGRSFDSAQDDAQKKRHMEWDSPWGLGFPGWHIECSAMSMKYLGETIDIHSAGIDHISIHSTNEIAQSEVATGKQFVRFWIHHNFLQVDGKKMSKSLNNFYTLSDIENKGYTSFDLRYLFLQAHYRQESNFTWESLNAASTALKQLYSHLAVIKNQVKQPERSVLSEEKLNKVNQLRKKFKDVIRYDLNTPQALGILWEIIKSNIPPGDKYDLLMICDEILGLGLKDIKTSDAKPSDIPKEIIELARKREKLRHENNFQEADQVRQEIFEKGYVVEDSSSGLRIKQK